LGTIYSIFEFENFGQYSKPRDSDETEFSRIDNAKKNPEVWRMGGNAEESCWIPEKCSGRGNFKSTENGTMKTAIWILSLPSYLKRADETGLKTTASIQRKLSFANPNSRT